MNVAVAHPDRVVAELTIADLQTIEAALRGYERFQKQEQTAYGVRIETLTDQITAAQDSVQRQRARAFGIPVPGDPPTEPGAF